MKISRGLWVAILCCSVAGSVQAGVYQPKDKTDAGLKSAEDLISKIPLIGKLPHSFLVGDGYKVKLSADALRIDHMGRNSKTGGSRNCLISLTYTTPVAGFFSSRIDLPLVASNRLQEGWTTGTVGDYVLHLSRDSVSTGSLRILFNAKF